MELAFTRSEETRLGHGASFADSSLSRATSSRPSAAPPSRLMRLIATSNGLPSAPASPSRFTATCCAMLAATPWRTPDMTHGPSRIGSVTAASSTPCVTLSCRGRGSRTFGADPGAPRNYRRPPLGRLEQPLRKQGGPRAPPVSKRKPGCGAGLSASGRQANGLNRIVPALPCTCLTRAFLPED